MTTTTPTTARPITGNDKLTALKHLANGHGPDFVAAALKLDANDIVRLGEEYGWPDPERLRWSIDELQRQERATERAALTRPASAATTPPPGRSATPARPVTPRPPVVDSLSGLLHRADQLDDGPGTAAVRRAAKKVRDAGVALEHALNDVETKHRKAREDAERKAQLRGTTAKPATKAATTGHAKAIRAWAAENGVSCPSVGRVPKAVREQYDAAHQDQP